MKRKLFLMISTVVLAAISSLAAAQDAPGAPGSNQAVPEKDPPLQGRSVTPGSGNLSNQLNQSNGVIAAPNVDPAIAKPAPATKTDGSVIRPPGTPGGSPAVQPK